VLENVPVPEVLQTAEEALPPKEPDKLAVELEQIVWSAPALTVVGVLTNIIILSLTVSPTHESEVTSQKYVVGAEG
jgi:hypothetical protein